MKYFPRLDGIRALAVIGVLLVHFFGQYVGHAQTGRLGVRVFFVLSGFLITRILIDYRSRMTAMEAAKAFYWRRLLRLAPPYYFAITASAALGIANMRQDWAWHALYLSNFLFDSRHIKEPVGHLWSLAIEEQFYILWFAVVMWLPRKHLLPAIVAAIIFAPIWRAGVLTLIGHHLTWVPSCLDFFAFGALIGLASLEHRRLFDAFANWGTFVASTLALIVLTAFVPTDTPLPGFVIGMFAASFIALATKPEARGLDWLNFRPLRDLGKVSYGVYLYHKFVPLLVGGLGLTGRPLVLGAIYTYLSVVIAALSWALLEKRVLRFKDYPTRQMPNHEVADSTVIDVSVSVSKLTAK